MSNTMGGDVTDEKLKFCNNIPGMSFEILLL